MSRRHTAGFVAMLTDGREARVLVQLLANGANVLFERATGASLEDQGRAFRVSGS
ncbi:MAG: hypothetical protein JWN70_934 [Planctomycetaceae bacterium]|nr:hypothetical protein [Planctomycetaceae bacterium]